jgi:hypothetical protein
MAFYQCRGYLRAVSSGSAKKFVTIEANTKFDCKKNMITKPQTNALDNTVYNIFMELKMSKLISPPSSMGKEPPNVLALKQVSLISVDAALASSIDLCSFDNEIESTFIIEFKAPDDSTLVYIQVGPDNSDN